MSQKFEDVFRSALKDQEVPFDPKAWDSMSARLDEVMPIKPKGGSNSLWIAASVAAVVGIGTLAYVSSGNDTDKKEEKKTVVVAQNNPTTNTEENSTLPSETIQEEQESIAPTEQSTSTPQKVNQTQNPVTGQPVKGKELESNPISPEKTIEEAPVKELPTKPNYIPTENYPAIGSICQFEAETIKNPFKLPLTFTAPSGKKQTIEAEAKRKIKFDEAGTYTMAVGDKKTQTLKITEMPTFDFEMGDFNRFENGVPTLKVSAVGGAENLVWSLKNGHTLAKGAEADIHLYQEGMYELVLTSETKNGCSNSVSKTVTVDEDYNLMAPTGFTPFDSDPRKATFMPYALKERNTEFVLIISDRRTGEQVFRTSDANNGWDGMIQNSGRMAEYNLEYVWTVSLGTPLSGEKTKYSGTVKLRK